MSVFFTSQPEERLRVVAFVEDLYITIFHLVNGILNDFYQSVEVSVDAYRQ